jgi:NitT/TauT family transport system substrate-binding protein
MLVREETIRKEPHRVEMLVSAHSKATGYLKDNKDVWLNKATEFGTPLEILRKAEPNMELAWKMDASFVEKAKALGGRMQALGVIDRQPDYEKLFNLGFVKKLMARMELK